jgi:hypothetical protein
LWPIDLAITAAAAVASVLLALRTRDAIFRAAHMSVFSLRSGFWWTIATASWLPVAVAAGALAIVYLLLFRRGAIVARRRGSVLPLLVLVVAFALPVGAMALAAQIATRVTAPAAPATTPIDVSNAPVPTLAPVPIAGPTTAPSARSGGAAAFVARSSPAVGRTSAAPTGLHAPKAPKQPVTPPPTPKPSPTSRSQTSEAQHQSQ